MTVEFWVECSTHADCIARRGQTSGIESLHDKPITNHGAASLMIAVWMMGCRSCQNNVHVQARLVRFMALSLPLDEMASCRTMTSKISCGNEISALEEMLRRSMAYSNMRHRAALLF